MVAADIELVKMAPTWCNQTLSKVDSCGLAGSEFDTLQAYDWMRHYRLHVAALVTIYVLISTNIGPRFMRDRKPYNIDLVQFVWNCVLAAYSWTSTYMLFDEFKDAVQQDGYVGQVCSARSFYSGSTGFVVWVFHVSKALELGDTMWLVLRKRPVQFLHWYHHALILLNAWFSYLEAGSLVRMGTFMNLIVHSVMYTYFAVQYVCGKRIPRFISLCVTSMQIIQFCIGTAYLVNVSYRVLLHGDKCDCDMNAMWRHILMYVSYLILFCHFFYRSYLIPKPKPKDA